MLSLNINRNLVIALLTITLASNAWGTDRFYSDKTVLSPNGRFKLMAQSPQNREGHRPFAGNFTYTLIDTKSNHTIWKRQQTKNEASPVNLFVSDDMWVVIRTGWDEVVALKPVSGEVALKFRILELFSEKDNEFVSQTTAGPMWSNNSRWYFLDHNGEVHFVIRTWWDRRIIANLDKGVVVKSIDDAHHAACDAADRAFVLQELPGALGRLHKKDKKEGAGAEDTDDTDFDYEVFWRIDTAVHLAGRMRVQEAIEPLREIQKSNHVGSSGGWWDTEGVYKDGDINPFNETEASLRRRAHLALRKLGAKPAELPCTWFRYTRPGKLGEIVELPVLAEPRASRLEQVMSGLKPIDVLRAIGAPDYVDFSLQAWEYDMDTDEPFTYRVYWKDKQIVDRVERVTPPLWKQGEVRYHQLIM